MVVNGILRRWPGFAGIGQKAPGTIPGKVSMAAVFEDVKKKLKNL